MIRHIFLKTIPVFILFISLFSCASPPAKPVSIREFTALGLDRQFDFDYSKEYILEHLNKKGVVVLEAKEKGADNKAYFIKIMATTEGPVAEAYPAD